MPVFILMESVRLILILTILSDLDLSNAGGSLTWRIWSDENFSLTNGAGYIGMHLLLMEISARLAAGVQGSWHYRKVGADTPFAS